MKYKSNLTDEQVAYLRANFEAMNNRELATALGVKLWQVRYQLYDMGLFRMVLEYWTEEQVQFLLDNYQVMGDKELAALLQERWPKDKGWTLKHVEKKRMYLKLKRTQAQLKAIKERNRQNGCFNTGKTWETRGVSAVGATRDWPDQLGKLRRFVKTEAGFVPMGPIVWGQHFGPVPEGYVIRHIDQDATNCSIENLECITLAENGRRNSGALRLTDGFVAHCIAFNEPALKQELRKHPQLLELARQNYLLRREIRNQKNQ